jgi:hypothetical protein
MKDEVAGRPQGLSAFCCVDLQGLCEMRHPMHSLGWRSNAHRGVGQVRHLPAWLRCRRVPPPRCGRRPASAGSGERTCDQRPIRPQAPGRRIRAQHPVSVRSTVTPSVRRSTAKFHAALAVPAAAHGSAPTGCVQFAAGAPEAADRAQHQLLPGRSRAGRSLPPAGRRASSAAAPAPRQRHAARGLAGNVGNARSA